MSALLLGAELRAGRPDAIKRLRNALRKTGSIRAAAIELGVSPRSLENWALADGERAIAAVLDTIREWRQANGSVSRNKNA